MFCPTPSTHRCDGDRDGTRCDKPLCDHHAMHLDFGDYDLCPTCVDEERGVRTSTGVVVQP